MAAPIDGHTAKSLEAGCWVRLQYVGDDDDPTRCFEQASADLEAEGIGRIKPDPEDPLNGDIYIYPTNATGIEEIDVSDDADYLRLRAVERVKAIVTDRDIELGEEFETMLGAVPHLPLYVAVHAGCNLRCWYCTEHGENRAYGPKLLPTARLIEILTEAHAAGFRTFRFTGGEPTLRRDLPEILKAVDGLSDDVKIAITTNGVRLGTMLDALGELRHRPQIFLSVDGLQEPTGDVPPDQADFQIEKWLTPQLGELIEPLTEIADVRLNYVLTTSSLPQIWDLIEFAATRSLDVKIFELLQRDFIKTAGLSGPKAFEAQYVPIRRLVPELIARFGPPGRFPGLGGRGIPMNFVSTGNSKVIYFDSLQGSHYSERVCTACRHFPCQEGLYAPVLNASGTLHPAGCMNLALYSNVAGADQSVARALGRLENEICRSHLKPDVPKSLAAIATGT
jgi:hypothetical protein